MQLTITNSTGQWTSALNIDYDVRIFSTTTNNNNYNTPYCSTTTGVAHRGTAGLLALDQLGRGQHDTNVADLDANGRSLGQRRIGVVHESAANYALGGTWPTGPPRSSAGVDNNARPLADQLLSLDNVVLGHRSQAGDDGLTGDGRPGPDRSQASHSLKFRLLGMSHSDLTEDKHGRRSCGRRPAMLSFSGAAGSVYSGGASAFSVARFLSDNRGTGTQRECRRRGETPQAHSA